MDKNLSAIRELIYGGRWTRAVKIAQQACWEGQPAGMQYVTQVAPDLCRSQADTREHSLLARVYVNEGGAACWEVVGSVVGPTPSIVKTRAPEADLIQGAVITWTTRAGQTRPMHMMTPTHLGHLVAFVGQGQVTRMSEWYKAVCGLLEEHRGVHGPPCVMREYQGTAVRVYREMGGLEVSMSQWGFDRWVSCYRGDDEVPRGAVPYMEREAAEEALRRISAILVISEMESWFDLDPG